VSVLSGGHPDKHSRSMENGRMLDGARPTGTPIRPYADSVTSPDVSASLPELHNTIVVAAFEGWNDAGDAASDALEHLDAIWEADPIVEIDDEAYYDYQVNRPVIRQVDGVTRELVWPSMRISHCRPPGADRDIVLMHGVEPNMRWRTFCAELLAVADKLNVDTVVILGALLADTPHTRPVPVSGAAYSPESARRFGLQETRYEGPTGIAGVFQDACVAAGIPAVTFWAAVPHYVSQPPNPKATVALLRRVEDVLDIEVPLADLPAQAEEWEQAVTEMTAEDDEVSEYVQSLEQRGDAEVDMNEALGKIDGDALAAEFERYLRRRRPGFGR
jgi:predicted ATP-grasp superfamily ATP-dependent carboligase